MVDKGMNDEYKLIIFYVQNSMMMRYGCIFCMDDFSWGRDVGMILL